MAPRRPALGELRLGVLDLGEQPAGALLGDLALGPELVDQVADRLERGLGRVEDLDLLDPDPEVAGRASSARAACASVISGTDQL